MNELTKILRIGIMPYEEYKKRTIAIAKGEYKPKKDEPKIWFTSIKSLAHVLSEENQQLLSLIIDAHPQSITELESLTGRKANNLLRTLRTMEGCGFVELVKGKPGKGRTKLIPKVLYDMTKIEINLGVIRARF